MGHIIKPVIVIPIYKNFGDWEQSEIFSFGRCITILNQHTIFLVGPEKLNWEVIKKQLFLHFGYQVSVKFFDNDYFKNIIGYNKLLKSSLFYRRFRKYSHLLIYQLDAYVFKDELLLWCEKEYDYIGAPWLEGFTDNSATQFLGVGNGGFSLRNIDAALKILPKIERVHKILDMLGRKKHDPIFSRLSFYFESVLLKGILGIGDISSYKKLNINNPINEDLFWGVLIPSVYKKFRIATVEEGCKFSFEVNPRMLFKKNNNKLPFGCHAWLKYDPDFWEKFVQSSN